MNRHCTYNEYMYNECTVDICTCLHSHKQVEGTRELKRMIQHLCFPDFKFFFSLLIFLPNKKENKERECFVLI